MSATTTIPTLETERLILRAPSLADLPALVAFFAGPRSHFVGGPLTEELVWRTLAGELGHWSLRGYGRWAVEDRATGAYCGLVGLWNPGGWPEPEIGWQMVDAAEGRGIAHEAALATRRYAYETLNWSTVISLIAVDNTRSRALAERLGAKDDGAFTHDRFGSMRIWRHPSPDQLRRAVA